jgi:phosphonate transport system permease protein
MSNPKVLLADEPVAALDHTNSMYVLALLRRLADSEGIAVVCVMHDADLAELFADRIIVLERGALVSDIENARVPQPKTAGSVARASILPATVLSELGVDNAASGSSPSPLSSKLPWWKIVACGAVVVGLLIWSGASLALGQLEWISASKRAFDFLAGLFPGSFAEIASLPWGTLAAALLETLQMALVGTVAATVLSLPLAACAASNLAPSVVRRPVRFLLNVIRTVPSLIWALICVAAIGFGPAAGVAALVGYSIGYLTKFFYEAFENVNRKTPEALAELGAGPGKRFVCGMLPLAFPSLVASMFFMFEYNVRAASVLGLVDAGGIGFYLKQYIDFRYFPAVGAGLLLLLVVVVALDSISQRLRAALSHLGD